MKMFLEVPLTDFPEIRDRLISQHQHQIESFSKFQQFITKQTSTINLHTSVADRTKHINECVTELTFIPSSPQFKAATANIKRYKRTAPCCFTLFPRKSIIINLANSMSDTQHKTQHQDPPPQTHGSRGKLHYLVGRTLV